MSRVSVVGLGRLGLPLAVALASKGFKVVGVDNNLNVLDAIKRGKPLTYEPGLEKLLRENRTKISVTDDLAGAVHLTEATFVMVATPSEDDGRLSLRYVLEVCRDIGKALKDKDDYHLVVINSTVNPTDCKELIHPVIERESGKNDFDFCYSPEFVALGNIIEGFLYPDFVLIGAEDVQSFNAAEKVYRRLCPDHRIVRTNLVNAELIKMWLNCTLITKICVANQIGEMCEAIPNADVDIVTHTIGLDTRISPRFLRGGTAYGGPCLLPYELIQTEEGLKRIDSVSAGDMVFSHDGRLHEVSKVYERDYSGKVLKIFPKGFNQTPLAVTPDHPIWSRQRLYYGDKDRFYTVSTTGERRLKHAIGYDPPAFHAASNLGIGDLMILPAIILDEISLPKVTLRYSSRAKIRYVDVVTPELMKLFGFYISEGYSWKRELKFSFHIKEVGYIKEITRIIADNFDLKTRIKRYSGKGVHTRTLSPILTEYLRKTFGHRAENKKVPHEWLALPDEYLIELLRGIWYGDGSNSGGVFIWATVSESLFNFMKLAFLKLGIAFTTQLYPPRVGKDGTAHQASYFLKVQNPAYFEKMNGVFPDLTVEYDGRKGKKSVWFENGRMFFHVRQIETMEYEGKVYNLEVVGSNSYMTQSAIVHNCFPRDSRSVLASANTFNVELPLIRAVEKVNRHQVDRLVGMIWSHRKSIEEKVGILGLSYKVGVDSMEPSTGLVLVKRIVPSSSVIAYDPMMQIGNSVRSAQICADLSKVVVITIPCPEFKNVRFHEGQVVIDCWRMLDRDDVEGAGAKYIAIGRG